MNGTEIRPPDAIDDAVEADRLPSPAAERHRERFGVYCIVSDDAIEWFLSMIRSFRLHNPTCPFVVIPFYHKDTVLKKWASVYDYEVMPQEGLKWLDEIGLSFYDGQYTQAIHHFRRLYSYCDGRFDVFALLDSDVVVLEDLNRIAKPLAESNLDFLSLDEAMEWVFRPGPLKDRALKLNLPATNAGLFFGRSGVFSREDFTQLAKSAAAVRDQFVVPDQSFMNYCLHSTDKRLGRSFELVPEVFYTILPHAPGMENCTNVAPLLPFHGKESNGKWTPFLHWAGIRLSPVMPLRSIYVRYRLYGEGASFRFRYLLEQNPLIYRIKRKFNHLRSRRQAARPQQPEKEWQGV